MVPGLCLEPLYISLNSPQTTMEGWLRRCAIISRACASMLSQNGSANVTSLTRAVSLQTMRPSRSQSSRKPRLCG